MRIPALRAQRHAIASCIAPLHNDAHDLGNRPRNNLMTEEAMHGVFLDRDTLDHGDIDFTSLAATLADWVFHALTDEAEVAERIAQATVVVSNKVMLSAAALQRAQLCDALRGRARLRAHPRSNAAIAGLCRRSRSGPLAAQCAVRVVGFSDHRAQGQDTRHHQLRRARACGREAGRGLRYAGVDCRASERCAAAWPCALAHIAAAGGRI